MALVEVNQVQVTFGEKTAVSAASFTIAKGETFNLIGNLAAGNRPFCACWRGCSASGAGTLRYWERR